MKKLKILLIFILGLVIFFSFNEFVLLKKNQILVETLATTGADFKVVIGKTKLYFQTKKYGNKMNNSGIMLSENNQSFYEFLNKNNSIYSNGDYLLLEYETIGTKRSDNPDFHPLIKVTSWKIINYLKFWSFKIIEILILILVVYLIRNK